MTRTAKKQDDKLTASLRAAQARVGRERDKLRDIASEAEGLADTCERAYDALQEAIDAMSELA